MKDLWIEIKTTSGPVVVGTVYTHSTRTIENFKRFFEKLLDIFNDLISNNRTFYALGDYNVDLLKVQTNNTMALKLADSASILQHILNQEAKSQLCLFFYSTKDKLNATSLQVTS